MPPHDRVFASDFEKRHEERFKGVEFDWLNFQRDGGPFPVPNRVDPLVNPAQEIWVGPDAAGAGSTQITRLGLRPAGVEWSPDGSTLLFTVADPQQLWLTLNVRQEDVKYLARGLKVVFHTDDGAQKVGFTAPGVDGQAAVIARAQAVAGVEPSAISYIEAHGTGTALGDPIEIAALSQAFGRGEPGSCAIGTLKSNLGHLDAAAGVAGLIKTVLALEHRELPPSLHYESPNPKIDFTNTPFYVNARLAPWKPKNGKRRAALDQ